MSTGKFSNQVDKEEGNWTLFNSFPRPELKLDILEELPRRFSQNFTVQNTYFSSSCVGNCSKVVILVSMILALFESVLFGTIVYSFYGITGMLIASGVLFVILIVGERYRIMWSVSWWRSLRQSEDKPHLAYEGTLNWTRSMIYLIVFLIGPIWIATLFYVIFFGDMHTGELLESRIIFVITTGIDLLVFLPFCACPTAMYAACFWKRVMTQEEKLQAQNLEEMGD